MTQTPEHSLAAAHVAAAGEMEPLCDLTGRLQALAATISRAAELGDTDQLAPAAEHLLQLNAEFARTYRAWLARRTTSRPPQPIDRARDEIARQIEAEHPGITVSHGIYGWAAAREGEPLTRAQSPDGLRALLPYCGGLPG
jgi:hypothetical protein